MFGCLLLDLRIELEARNGFQRIGFQSIKADSAQFMFLTDECCIRGWQYAQMNRFALQLDFIKEQTVIV